MVEPTELYYEILLRADYESILKLLKVTQIDPILSPLLWIIFRNDEFWYRKLSMKIKTYHNPSVGWHQAYIFFDDEPASWTEKLEKSARDGYSNGINLLILNGVNPSVDDNYAIRSV